LNGISEGQLCGAYDDMGTLQGICIFLASHEQWTLGDKVENPIYWHYEVLQDGEVKYLSTNKWTLIPMNTEDNLL
jgi:hypothetical protein